MNTIRVFDFNLANANLPEAVDALTSTAQNITAFFVNAHCINVSYSDEEYAQALRQSDILLPDGSGVALAVALQGKRFAANLNGTDLFIPLCRAAAEKGLSIYFLGSAPGVSAGAAAAARRAVPHLNIAGTDHGYFKAVDDDRVVERINKSGADIVLVAMGVPKQEHWITKHRKSLRAHLVMGVGAQFDFHAGRVRRAPKLVSRLGCEWIWRLAMEPRRMAKRYILGNPLFVMRAIKQAFETACAHSGLCDFVKRSYETTITLGIILALSPLLLATAAVIKLDSRGPVLFCQTRVGKDGKPFQMLKFRSMYRDAEARRAQLLAQSDRAGVCFKAKHDPRITRVGRWIRRFSIDELPQLFNVVTGEMALVGPRPALPSEVAAYPQRAFGRLAVKPGLTGIWQVSGRADIGFNKMIDMDLAYAESRSFWLDLAILAMTGWAVISGRGAY